MRKQRCKRTIVLGWYVAGQVISRAGEQACPCNCHARLARKTKLQGESNMSKSRKRFYKRRRRTAHTRLDLTCEHADGTKAQITTGYIPTSPNLKDCKVYVPQPMREVRTSEGDVEGEGEGDVAQR